MDMLQVEHRARDASFTARALNTNVVQAPNLLAAATPLSLLRAAAGDKLFSQGETSQFIYQVRHGLVRTTKLMRDGRRVVQGFHVPGDIFGINRTAVHATTAEAVCDVHYVRCERSRFEDFVASNVDVAQQLWTWLIQCSERFEQLSLLGRGSAVEKLAYFLLDMAERTGAKSRIELFMSRYDIGDYLGLSSETVSRAFTLLRERRIIHSKGRLVVFLDLPALRQLSSPRFGLREERSP
jgi:CRP-like cAMP-binding protein